MAVTNAGDNSQAKAPSPPPAYFDTLPTEVPSGSRSPPPPPPGPPPGPSPQPQYAVPYSHHPQHHPVGVHYSISPLYQSHQPPVILPLPSPHHALPSYPHHIVQSNLNGHLQPGYYQQHPGGYLPTPPLHAVFGPTPAGQLNLPFAYHDLRSQHAIEVADARASRRFWGSFFWAFFIWWMLWVFIEIEMDIIFGRHGHRHRGGDVGTY